MIIIERVYKDGVALNGLGGAKVRHLQKVRHLERGPMDVPSHGQSVTKIEKKTLPLTIEKSTDKRQTISVYRQQANYVFPYIHTFPLLLSVCD